MALYDTRDPRRRTRVIRGYDRPHAVRTARMCTTVAARLGHRGERLRSYEIACLLHDLGRAGLDRTVFGPIWTWAKRHGVPTRPREWRAVHPRTRYGRETEAFLRLYRRPLQQAGIDMDPWATEQVEMRLGYARRFRRRLSAVASALRALGITWSRWMTDVVLYYYYPERLTGKPAWVRELAEILVACEQFEAYSNRRRGRDYYARRTETLTDAFGYLDKLRLEGIVSVRVIGALRDLCAEGVFDRLLAEARGVPLSAGERRYLATRR